MQALGLHKKGWLYAISIAFICLCVWSIYKENYLGVLVPLALAIVYASIYHTKAVLLFVVFCTPFSLNLESMDLDASFGFFLPTEPILFGLMVLIILKWLSSTSYHREIVNHPITYAVLFYLAWIFVTCFTSEHPIVSLKFFISKLWFVIPLFFFGVQLFKKEKNIYLVQWLYLIPLALVVLITLIRHYGHGFDQEIAHWIMNPFFKDHTSYGAIVAFFIPIAAVMLLRKGNTAAMQLTLGSILAILIIGLIFSYTRAAWLSLLASFGVFLLFKFKIKFKYVAILTILAGVVALGFYNEISMTLSKNDTDSSDNFSKHIESISNISTDASNLERINRWKSAYKMFQERPFFGWGGGTYAFEYAPFQHSGDLTIISTNFGDKGNAHSEYLGALAETGVLGLLSLLILLTIVFYKASMLYINLEDANMRWIVLGIIMALTSYFAHGFLNNYLDTDKASVPIWLSFAIILMLDLKVKKQLKEKTA